MADSTRARTRRLIKSPKDFWAAWVYLTLAATALVIASNYPLGTAFRMGPAYFPKLLAWLLAGVGMISLLFAFTRDGGPMPRFAWREMGIVLGAVTAFAVIVRGAGLVPALLVLVFVSSMASASFRVRTAALLALSIAGFCYVVFLRGLELPLRAFGPWFGQ